MSSGALVGNDQLDEEGNRFVHTFYVPTPDLLVMLVDVLVFLVLLFALHLRRFLSRRTQVRLPRAFRAHSTQGYQPLQIFMMAGRTCGWG